MKKMLSQIKKSEFKPTEDFNYIHWLNCTLIVKDRSIR